MLRRFAVRQSRNRHRMRKVCEANERSEAKLRSPLSPPKGRLQTKRFAVFYLFCKLREGSEPHRRCCGGLPSGRAATDKECERFAKQTNEAKLRSPLSPPKERLQTKRFAVFLITQFTKTERVILEICIPPHKSAMLPKLQCVRQSFSDFSLDDFVFPYYNYQ